MVESLSLLVVEDSDADFARITSDFKRQGLAADCTRVACREQLVAGLESGHWDVVLSDYRIQGLEFSDIFRLIREGRPDLPVILLSGSLGEEEAVDWLKRGVADFVFKDRPARLAPAIQRALREKEEQRSRKAAEEALRRSRELLRLITDAAPALISYIDTDYRYRLMNRCYERWFGRKPEKMVGRPVREVLGDAAWKMLRPYMDRALAGEVVSFEQELPNPGAGPRWVQVIYTPHRDLAGVVRGFVVLVQDLDERKEAELALEAHRAHLEEMVEARTAELAASNRELQAFTYAVSHDLKAPLRGINAFCSLLERRYRDQLDGEGDEILDFIQHNVQRMNSLIEDLLDYARMEQRSLSARPVDLAAAVDTVLAEKKDEIRQQAAEVTVSLPTFTVQADPEGLAQVLRNLIDNALKFSSQARPPRIEIGGEVEGEGGCRFWVRDNGVGFSMAQHDRIFEIFQRLHSVDDFPGTGIGLALIRKAMERMGGRVWAESEPGQGATFFLVLPGG